MRLWVHFLLINFGINSLAAQTFRGVHLTHQKSQLLLTFYEKFLPKNFGTLCKMQMKNRTQ